MESLYRKLYKIELADDDFKKNGLRIRVVKLWYSPEQYTCLTMDQLKLILKLWIQEEEERYPQPKFRGRWLLFNEIKKIFEEEKIEPKDKQNNLSNEAKNIDYSLF